jgi:hypothetical protein
MLTVRSTQPLHLHNVLVCYGFRQYVHDRICDCFYNLSCCVDVPLYKARKFPEEVQAEPAAAADDEIDLTLQPRDTSLIETGTKANKAGRGGRPRGGRGGKRGGGGGGEGKRGGRKRKTPAGGPPETITIDSDDEGQVEEIKVREDTMDIKSSRSGRTLKKVEKTKYEQTLDEENAKKIKRRKEKETEAEKQSEATERKSAKRAKKETEHPEPTSQEKASAYYLFQSRYQAEYRKRKHHALSGEGLKKIGAAWLRFQANQKSKYQVRI